MPGPRAYVSEYTISVGPINLLGRLYGVKASGSDDDNKFVSVCPECPTPIKPAQVYVCDTGHTHPIGELLKAKALDDKSLAFVATESVAEARKSDLPLNVFRATVHNAEEVETATFPSDSAYVFEPRNRDEYFDLVIRLVEDSDKAFIAQSNVRNHENLYRLVTWRGNLLIQRLFWPNEVNEFPEHVSEVEQKVFNAAVAMVERVEEPFDPATYVASTKEKLTELVASLDPNAPAPAAPATQPRRQVAATGDLLAALSSFGDLPDRTPAKAKKARKAS